MNSVTRVGLLLGVLLVPVAGCAHAQQAAPVASPSSSRSATSAVAFDPIAVEAASNTFGSLIETTAPTALTSAEAVGIVSAGWRSQDASPTFVATRKVIYSGYGVKDRVVWLVGAAPVPAHGHGPYAQTWEARGVYVVDAATGEILSSGYTSLEAIR